MRPTPNIIGFIYGAMGVLFTYLAIQSVEETIWNLSTVLLMAVATFDFLYAIRIFNYKKYLEKKN